MDKIKVIFTGGTIGSRKIGNQINTNSEMPFLLLQNYGKDLERFSTCSILNILSENATIEDVIEMKKEIEKSQNEDGVKGVILTHGTDTLAFTSAYLSFLLKGLKVPVVLVSSNMPIDDKRANGNVNFATAVALLDTCKLQPNVYVVFKNESENFVSVFLGCKMREPAPFEDDFETCKGERFARFENGNFVFENTNCKAIENDFNFVEKKECLPLFIHAYSGLNYEVFSACKPTFVLQQFYHSGTANATKRECNSFVQFAKICKEKKIPLYACNVIKKDTNYASVSEISKDDVCFLYNMLSNVALAKLVVAYSSLDVSEISRFLSADIAGEFLQ